MSDNQIFIKSKKLSSMSAVMAFISRTTELKDISQFISCNFSSKMWWRLGDGERLGGGGGGSSFLAFYQLTKLKGFSFIYHTHFYFNEAFSLEWI